MEPSRHSIKEPIPEIFEAWSLLSDAVNAHLTGDRAGAEALFRKADLSEVWHWTNPAFGPSPHDLRKNVKVFEPVGDTKEIQKSERDPRRAPSNLVKAAVLQRDGYRCRYCGIPVIAADIRKIARSFYADAIPWDVPRQHAAFECLWLQYDHVVPHSHGGSSLEENIVVACALCNFGKDKYTLKQLAISDPRSRPPQPTSWDGLERLRTAASIERGTATAEKMRRASSAEPTTSTGHSDEFFIPDAWISAGYVFTKTIDGKQRWFKLSTDLTAEPVIRGGVTGCRLVCDPDQFRRRGLSPAAFADRVDAS